MPRTGSRNAPEARAREKIDALLEAAGWAVQDRDEINLGVPVVAVREFPLARGHGFADYLLFLDRRAVGDASPSEFRRRIGAGFCHTFALKSLQVTCCRWTRRRSRRQNRLAN